MFSNAQDAPPLLLHPHDPCVEEEYETLIRAWKTQLIDHTPAEPSHDYVRLAWMRLMDHYLDQHWLDSKQMLQCAQAWSARDELSLAEAVHTMNILSLKTMQRLLDARQELLQALGDPDLIGIARPRMLSNASSLTGSEEDVHAPLLVQHINTPTQDNFNLHDDESIMISKEEEDKEEDEEAFLVNYGYNLDELVDLSIEKEEFIDLESRQVIEDLNVEEKEEASEDISPLASLIYSHSITSSMSSPNISTNRNHDFSNRKYESYYQNLHQASSWKEIQKRNSDLVSENSFSSNSDDSSPLLSNSVQWKSWFLGEQSTEFAKEKVETDGTFPEEYIKKQSFSMVRSESSISAFRPISNNLAPRCKPPAITKSRSFPSKSTLSESMKKSSSTPPPVPQQRNFMIRSIVSKKASLSKLFSSKKASSSSNI
ncbi:hypothetical protein INT48_005905 [Thamnidium elegans]|uniref:Uncharacterized protein n=1 Tax=Thamnidium elegans TaxID=101142 RepID=A0A8H7SM32_9FUNG|nr:hypothetical protein INT48_005905 [Thamnidium elegans]